MDPISAAASIVSVAELVMRVVDYLHTVKQGGFVRKKLQDETLVLWLGVSTLRRQFDPVPASLDEPWMEPLQVLLEPGGVMQQMREVLEELESKLKGRPSKLGQAWLTLCWPFEEKEAQKIIDRIHRLSTTANLAVSQSSHQLNREMIGDIGKIKTMAENSHFQTVNGLAVAAELPAEAGRGSGGGRPGCVCVGGGVRRIPRLARRRRALAVVLRRPPVLANRSWPRPSTPSSPRPTRPKMSP